MKATERYWLEVSASPLQPEALLDFVRSDRSGGIDMFLGAVRNINEGRQVSGLSYEAYPAMCEKLLAEIILDAMERWPIHKIAAHHRLGSLALQDYAVIVAVSSQHRAEAFAACRHIIDEIKHSLPIWKKEHYVNHPSQWVRCNHTH